MSEPTFSELHPGAASTLTTGVDLAGIVANDQASPADASASAGMGGDAVILMAPPPKLASFSVYWDASAKTLKMYNPKVVYGAKTLDVTGADALDSGSTYVCVVKTSETDGTTAKIEAVSADETDDETDDDSASVVCRIPICAIDAKGHVTQYHVGVIVLGGAAASVASAFSLVETKGENGTERSVVNCYWNAAGLTCRGADQDIGQQTGYVCAKFEGLDFGEMSIVSAESLDALQGLQKDSLTYVVPLYFIGGDDTVVDLRTAPQLQMFEGALS